jgi:tetratricopeptide (TPR) repeat protein
MTGPSLRELALASLLFGVLALATHGSVINNDYAFDAFYTVRDNPQVEADATLAEIFTSSYWDAERFPGRGLYRPISVLSFQLTRRLWDDPVGVDHGIDLALHVVCSLALFGFLMQMGARRGVALCLGGLFLLHPVQTEAVASLVGRCDLLATLFALLAMNLALARRISGPSLWLGLWGLFSLSLLAKESTVALVVLLPACWVAREHWQGNRMAASLRTAAPLGLSLLLALACHLILRQTVLDDLLVREVSIEGDSGLAFFELRWRALAFGSLYAQKLLWPYPLLPDYATGVIAADGFTRHLRALVTGLLMVASVAWAATSWHRRRTLTRTQLGVLLFGVALSPVSNLILQIGTPFAERLVYFPMIFLLLAAIDLPLWRPTKFAGLGLGPKLWLVWAGVAITFAITSATRIEEWKDNHSLFRAAVRDCPDNYYSQMSFGATLMRDGGGATERELTLEAFRAAARIRPEHYSPPAMMGQLAFAEGDYESARFHFERADARTQGLDREPSAINLARTYRALNEFERFEAYLQPIAETHPEWIEVQRDLGDYWLTRLEIGRALTQFERVVIGAPRDLPAWRAIVWGYLTLGQPEQAAKRLEAAPKGTVDYRFKVQLERDGLSLPTDAARSGAGNGL